MKTEIKLQNIDNVIVFLPLFERREKLYELRLDIEPFAPHIYTREVEEFISTLRNEGFIVLFDWPTWSNDANRLVSHPELLNSATLDMLQKLLTTHLRKERFCSGHIAGMIGNGNILAILQRLATIRAEMALGSP